MVGRDAVDADSDHDPVLSEPTYGPRVQQDAVGLHTDLDRAVSGQRGAYLGGEPTQPGRAVQERLAAVQDDPDAGQPMPQNMTAQPRYGRAPHLLGHQRRPVPPALVRLGVDVAVVAGQVAALMDLQHQVVDRRGSPTFGAQPGHVEFEVRPRRGPLLCGADGCGGGRDAHETKFWKAEMTPFGSSRLWINRSTHRASAVSPFASSSTTGRWDTSSNGDQRNSSPADGVGAASIRLTPPLYLRAHLPPDTYMAASGM
jgi:hypothetical protein